MSHTETSHVTQLGRAYVRLIEAAQVLIEHTEMDEQLDAPAAQPLAQGIAVMGLVGNHPFHF